MKNIMKQHMERYPKMQIRDMLKLIYQSEFGGDHMIKDKKKSLEWIKKEHGFIRGQNWLLREGTCEEIGDGMWRMYLDVLETGLSEETLNEMFAQSANAKTGTLIGLEKKLECFLELCEKGEMPFSYIEVKETIGDWKEQEYPAIHHSETFRNNYFPAYRVVMKKYAERVEVFRNIDQYLKNHKVARGALLLGDDSVDMTSRQPIVIAIDGTAGVGKSVLGQMLSEIYQCNLFHMDDFFLQTYQRTPERLAEPGGNVDYERFKTEVLDQLDNLDGLWYQKYDCSTQSLKEKEFVPYNNLVIIEGAYSLHPYFEDRANLAFFMEIPEQVQIERIRRRNGEWMLKRFVEEWIPMEQKYFETYRIKEKATLI